MPYAASSTAGSPESGSPAARTVVPGSDAVLRAVCTVHAGPAPGTVCVAPGGARAPAEPRLRAPRRPQHPRGAQPLVALQGAQPGRRVAPRLGDPTQEVRR